MKKFTLGVFAISAILFTSCSNKKVHVERTTTINASAESVYNNVNCLKNWKSWSPWAKMDMSITEDKNYSGPECGVGSKVTWDSEHEKVGKGIQTISKSVPSSEIVIDLDFYDKGTGKGTWEFEEIDGATKVTWNMDSEMPVFITWFMDMEDILGPVFEEGLAGLKTTIESQPQTKIENAIINANSLVNDVVEVVEEITK